MDLQSEQLTSERSIEVPASQSFEHGRTRRLISAVISAFISKGLVIIVNALTIPIMVRYLGAEYFGIWVTLTTALTLLLALDLGISNSLTNFISEAFAIDNKDYASAYSTTSLAVMSLFSVVAGILAWMIWPALNWKSIFHLSSDVDIPLISHASAAALIVFLFGMPSSLGAKVLGGYQKVRVSNLFSTLGSTVSFLLILLLVLMHAGLVSLVAAACGGLVAVNFGTLFWLWTYHMPWLRPRIRHISRPVAMRLLRTGWHFFILQLAGIIVYNTDNLIVTHFLGPAQVTSYSVTWRLVGYSAILQSLLTPALWPAYSEAFVRGDLIWIRKMFRRILLVTMGASIAFAGVFALGGRAIIKWWATSAAEPSESLLLLMCLWIIISTFMNNTATILVAKGDTVLQAWCSLVAAGLNLWLSIVLVQRIGAEGVILGTILSYLAVLIVPQTWKTWRVLRD